MRKNKNEEFYKEVKELRYNKDLSIKELAQYYGKSERTIYRWLQKGREQSSNRPEPSKKQRTRSRKYPREIFRRIIELKKEILKRSAPMVHRHLEEEFICFVLFIFVFRKYIKV
ncbi:MAG: hypothetical protein GF311_19585 [Candidatus Lokiarchaeota archaeon]|nr:hypothetical protein [Candidatus Lokiarchaeota archaeon]